MKTPTMIFDFNNQSPSKEWQVVDDGVMGGLSAGKFEITEAGYGKFSGSVSLENNGGFSSVRHSFSELNINESSKFIIKVKGDGKHYQFRIKDETNHAYSYRYEFISSTDWKTIEIYFKEFTPVYRGRILDLPPFTGESLSQVSFLIANKTSENFSLLIDEISVD